MACNITDIKVVGDGASGVPPTTLTVSGHAQDCDTIRVRVICFIGGLPTEGDTSVDLATGEWSVELTPQPNYVCLCGSTITVHAECVSDPTCSVDLPVMIQCLGACPIVSDISVVPYTTCNPDGTRRVTFSVTITDTSGSGGTAEWQFEPASYGGSFPFAALGSTTKVQEHDYAAPGSYTATLSIGFPFGCPPVEVPVNVEECPPQCPEPSDISVTVGDCNPDGTRDVTFAFSTDLTVDVEFGDSSSVSLTGASVTHPYLPVGPYTAVLTFNGCPPIQIPVGPLEECQPECPEPSDVSVTVGDCNPDGTRDVTFSFSTTLTADIDFGDGSPLTGVIGASAVKHAYVPVGPYTAVLTVEGCPPLEIPLGPLGECPGTVPGGGGGGFNFCTLLFFVAIGLLLAGGVLLIVGICSGLLPLTIAGGIAVAVGLLLFALWAFLCGASTSCSAMQTVDCILYFIEVLILPIIFVVLLLIKLFGGGISLPCLVATAGTWAGWGTIEGWLRWVMKKAGCATKCP